MSNVWDPDLRASEGAWEVVHVASLMDDTPSEVWVFDLDGITTTPRALAQNFLDDVVAKSGMRDGFVIKERTSSAEWGFSATSWELAITVLAGIVGPGAYDLIKAHAAAAVAERRQLPMTREEALSAAKKALAMRYPEDVSAGDLELVWEESSDGGLVWTFGLRTEHTEFEWQMDGRDGFRATRIRRTGTASES